MSLEGTSDRDSETKILCCTRLRVNEEIDIFTCCKIFAVGQSWVGGLGLSLRHRDLTWVHS
jgi:hypothetical protein